MRSVLPDERVCVIGAGPSGLAACKALFQAGIPFDCFEAGPNVGGVWDVEGSDLGGYRSLYTNTSKTKMAFSDFPFPDESPPFIHHSGMLEYFNAYTDHFGFRDQIHFKTKVINVRPVGSDAWSIELEDGSQRPYRACIVATGQYGTKRWPNKMPAGQFDGQSLHASDYLDPEHPVDCRGKRIVVVGLGSSAAEIATELAGGDEVGDEKIATHVTLSARSGRFILPKTFEGEPLDASAPHPAADGPRVLNWIPGALRTWLLQRFLRFALGRIEAKSGRPSDWNLPNPDFPAWAERPTLSDGFIPALAQKRIDARPGIDAFDGNIIRFKDGGTTEADIIIWATGYRPSFPFLKPDVLGCDPSDLALYRRIAHPTRPGLYFIGFTRVICSLWPLSEQQALWLVDVLKGSIKRPSADRQSSRSVNVAKTLPVFCNSYVLDLRSDR